MLIVRRALPRCTRIITPPGIKMGFMRDFSAPTTRDPSPMDADSSMRANAKKAAAIARDFRTDTITVPTAEMLQASLHASLGDDVYGEDSATSDLEEKIARLAGKEAAMFAVSGTMTNQLALRSHLKQPPYSVILDSRAHVHQHEAGGLAVHTGATSYALKPENGHHLTLDEVLEAVVEGDDIHTAPTRVVCLENTLSGMVFPQDEIVRISDAMHELGIIMHLDGARLWEVVAKTGKSLEELCAPFDSVSLCMSKGLGAPIGSVLVGSKELITRCKWNRKMFGGGIRQSGGLAASANYALDHHLPKLPATHERARFLARGLSELGVRLMLPVETNMLWIDPTPLGFTLDELADRVRMNDLRIGASRLVCHHQVTQEAVEDLISVVKQMKEEYAGTDPLSAPFDEEMSRMFAEGRWEKAVPHVKARQTAYAASKK